MVLQKQVITLDFGYGGLDQKTDDKLILPTRMAELANGRFNKTGRVDRRFGNEAAVVRTLSPTGVPSSFSTTVSKLISAEAQLMAISGPLIGISNTTSATPRPFRLMPTGDITAGGSSVRNQYMPVSELRSVEFGTNNYFDGVAGSSASRADSTNAVCFVYTTNALSGFVQLEIYDKSTKSLIKTDKFAGSRPRVLSHPDGRDQWVIGYNASVTTTVSFATVSLTTASAAVTGMPDETTVQGGEWDFVVLSDATESLSAMLCVAYAKNATGLRLRRASWPATNGSGAALSTTTITPSSGNVTRVSLCNTHNRSNTAENFRPSWFESGAGIRTATYNRSLTQVLAPASVTTSTVEPRYLAGCQIASGEAQIFVDYPATAATILNKVQAYTIDTSNGAGAAWLQLGVSLHSKPACRLGDNVPYLWASWSNTGQNTLFLLASQITGVNRPFCSGRLFHTTAFGLLDPTLTGLPNIDASSGEFVGSAMQLVQIGTANVSADQYVLRETRFGLDVVRGWVSSQHRGDVLITGGYLSAYRQAEGITPAGPQLFPVFALSATTSGGSMALGSYFVSGIWEFVDSKGRIHRSAPCAPVAFSLTGTQNALIVTFQNYTLSDEYAFDSLGAVGNLRFVPFRTLTGGSGVFYRATQAVNGPNIDTSIVNLNSSDSVISTAEPLYTTGNVVENWQPSAPIALATNGRRFLAVSGDRPNFIMEGKPITDREGVAFFEELGRTLNQGGDRVYALASFLDKWFAFKERNCYVASGDGADKTGSNDTLSEFEPLLEGIGCREPRSVVATSAGVVFKSISGFYIIGGDLQARYIGADVENYNTQTVTDSAYDQDADECHFTMSGGDVLVLTIYTTAQGVDLRWSYDTACGGNSAAIVQGTRYIAPASISGLTATIYRDSLSYIDAQVSVTAQPDFAATTAWAQLGQLQGYGRVYKANIIGKCPAAQTSFTAIVAIGYDYDNASYSETHTISAANFVRKGDNVQFEIRPARQKCEAMRFRVTQQVPSANTSLQVLSLNQIELIVGVKTNDNKIAPTARGSKS